MALRDYILCKYCECKLVYDGYDNVRDSLEEKYGVRELICPNCLKVIEDTLNATPKVELLGYTMQHHIHRLSLQGSVALSVEKVQRSAFNIPLYIMKTRIKITEANFDQLTPEQLRDGEI